MKLRLPLATCHIFIHGVERAAHVVSCVNGAPASLLALSGWKPALPYLFT
jgi:hypothetical protein